MAKKERPFFAKYKYLKNHMFIVLIFKYVTQQGKKIRENVHCECRVVQLCNAAQQLLRKSAKALQPHSIVVVHMLYSSHPEGITKYYSLYFLLHTLKYN